MLPKPSWINRHLLKHMLSLSMVLVLRMVGWHDTNFALLGSTSKFYLKLFLRVTKQFLMPCWLCPMTLDSYHLWKKNIASLINSANNNMILDQLHVHSHLFESKLSINSCYIMDYTQRSIKLKDKKILNIAPRFI